MRAIYQIITVTSGGITEMLRFKMGFAVTKRGTDELKLAKVMPIFKKKDDLDKENYRPVSILPHVSKFLKESCIII